MIPRNFFSKSITIERTLEAIYAHWAETAAYGEKRCAMWRKLSQDEEGHALDLELASRLAAKDGVGTIPFDIAFLDKLQLDLDELLAAIKVQPLSDPQAVKVAVDIEAKTMAVHARSALTFNDPELKRLFLALGTYDKKHLADLAQAYTEQFEKTPTAMLNGGIADG